MPPREKKMAAVFTNLPHLHFILLIISFHLASIKTTIKSQYSGLLLFADAHSKKPFLVKMRAKVLTFNLDLMLHI